RHALSSPLHYSGAPVPSLLPLAIQAVARQRVGISLPEQFSFRSIDESASVGRALGSPSPDTCEVCIVTDTATTTAAAPSTAPGAPTVRDHDRLTLPAALLDVRAVAELLDCSTRHVYRLADAGLMPGPVRIGALVRWRRQELMDWIAKGCVPCRTRGGR